MRLTIIALYTSHFKLDSTKGQRLPQNSNELCQEPNSQPATDVLAKPKVTVSDDNWKHAVNLFTSRQHTNINQNFTCLVYFRYILISVQGSGWALLKAKRPLTPINDVPEDGPGTSKKDVCETAEKTEDDAKADAAGKATSEWF